MQSSHWGGDREEGLARIAPTFGGRVLRGSWYRAGCRREGRPFEIPVHVSEERQACEEEEGEWGGGGEGRRGEGRRERGEEGERGGGGEGERGGGREGRRERGEEGSSQMRSG